MGLTKDSVGTHAADTVGAIQRQSASDRIVALAGNPNVGKSTVFNGLTGMKQHTGNWPGKTVTSAQGYCKSNARQYLLVDLPGTYSLDALSAEEEVTREFLRSGDADAVVIVCDATCLERNLILVLQILEITRRVIVCVNLMDEAERKQIHIDTDALSDALGVPVVGTKAQEKQSLQGLIDALDRLFEASAPAAASAAPTTSGPNAEARILEANRIAAAVTQIGSRAPDRFDRRLDRLLTGRRLGYPIMVLLLALILFLTIYGANIPSELLSHALFSLQDVLSGLLLSIGTPIWLHDALVLGVYRTLAWVVAVMLPPMAIFFPLFTLLEDIGYLPRIAYNLDKCFHRCHACGKQALTMCMGFGCNAAGVVGCRIIDSPRERLIAMLTNSFVPCNGRFPTLITLISMFFVGTSGGLGSAARSAILLTAVLLLGIGMTFLSSRLLSVTVLRGLPSAFTLELPPYRRPQIGRVIVRSVLDRTLFVLGRAAAVAAPAGLILFVTANVTVSGTSLLAHAGTFLNPFGTLLGLDGMILVAFLLGFPANEIVLPILLMAYTAQGSLIAPESTAALRTLLIANGWTWKTAVSMLLFSLMHWPCSTTLWTIRKESGSLRWTLLAALLPTGFGILCCLLFQLFIRALGL